MGSESSIRRTVRRWVGEFVNAPDPAQAEPTSRLQVDRGQLVRLLEDTISATGIPGISVSLIVDDAAVNASAGLRSMGQYFALEDTDVFEPFGLTGLFVAGVIHELARAGELGLDVPIARLLPDLGHRDAGDSTTVGHLLSHTGGYLAENPADLDRMYAYTWDKFAAFYRLTPQIFAPGTVFNSADSGYAMLCEIVQRVVGDDPMTLADDMFSTQLALSKPQEPAAAVRGHAFLPDERGFEIVDVPRPCGFWSSSLLGPPMSPETMARLAGLLLNGDTLASTASADLRMPVVQLPDQLRGTRCAEWPFSFGLGCGQFDSGGYGLSTSGMGQCAAVRVLPELTASLAVALNCHAPHVRDRVVADLVEMLTGEHRPPLLSHMEVEFPFDELVGVYRSAQWDTLQVSLDGERMRIANGYNPWVPVERTVSGASLAILDQRTCALADGLEDWSVGFFGNPIDGGPCLMSGLSAYVKVE